MMTDDGGDDSPLPTADHDDRRPPTASWNRERRRRGVRGARGVRGVRGERGVREPPRAPDPTRTMDPPHDKLRLHARRGGDGLRGDGLRGDRVSGAVATSASEAALGSASGSTRGSASGPARGSASPAAVTGFGRHAASGVCALRSLPPSPPSATQAIPRRDTIPRAAAWILSTVRSGTASARRRSSAAAAAGRSMHRALPRPKSVPSTKPREVRMAAVRLRSSSGEACSVGGGFRH